MAVQLNAKETENAKHWLSSVFTYGGLAQGRKFFKYWPDPTAIKKICDEIKFRQFTFISANLDAALYNLSTIKFRSGTGGTIQRSTAQLAEYIAWFCSTKGLIWDDSTQSQQLMDEYIKTILGKALYEAGCFLNTKPNTPAVTQKSVGSRAASTRQPGQAPQNGYKGTGGHSAEIPNLIGTPGAKIILTGKLLCIEADKIGANTPKAFITPIKTNASGVIQVSQSTAETVNFGSGQGYTDCKLWFDDTQKATAFMNDCINKFGNKFTNIHLAYKSADPNGYFKVSTEFGEALIKASVLNEDIQEALARQERVKNAIGDIDIYNEWFNASIS